MIPLFTREQAQQMDREAIERLGVPSVVLMENAGANATRLIVENFKEDLSAPLILGGPGQNGGDAWVVARHLAIQGYLPQCILVGSESKLQGDAKTNWEILKKISLRCVEVSPDKIAEFKSVFDMASLIVDGLFGTGLNRELQNGYLKTVLLTNRAEAAVISLDLPSGLDANTGSLHGLSVIAEMTTTFHTKKIGLFVGEGPLCSGSVKTTSIGIPLEKKSVVNIIEINDISNEIQKRTLDSHKGSHGHLLVVAGSNGKVGAALLTSKSALRAGSGLVTWALKPEIQTLMEGKIPEVMTAPFSKEEAVLANLLKQKTAAVIGPGFGTDATAKETLRDLSLSLTVPTVLDADALTAWEAKDWALLKQCKAPRVLTPHPKEAARLLKASVTEVQKDRLDAARKIAEQSGQVTVLKGMGTVIASADGQVWICNRGTPALATGGTGDVLSGVIGGLLANGLAVEKAAWCGVMLHAIAGELATKTHLGFETDRGILASEVADAVPDAFAFCFASSKASS